MNEQKLKRRLSAYPSEMWEILALAMNGKGYEKEFAFHHQATAFVSRFYKFRLDAIEAGVKGAIALRELSASGVDALGGLFNTRSQGAGGPYVIRWTHSSIATGVAAQVAAQPFEPSVDVPQDDKGAEMLGLLMQGGRSTARELTPEELAAHEAAKQHEAARRVDETLPKSLEQALCDHEADVTGTFCLKCRVPMVL
jgi:hypothetical protein